MFSSQMSLSTYWLLKSAANAPEGLLLTGRPICRTLTGDGQQHRKVGFSNRLLLVRFTPGSPKTLHNERRNPREAAGLQLQIIRSALGSHSLCISSPRIHFVCLLRCWNVMESRELRLSGWSNANKGIALTASGMVSWLISTYYIAKQDLQTGQELNRW